MIAKGEGSGTQKAGCGHGRGQGGAVTGSGIAEDAVGGGGVNVNWSPVVKDELEETDCGVVSCKVIMSMTAYARK